MGETLNIRPFVETDRDQVIALWHAAGLTVPHNDPDQDIDRKMAVGDGLFLAADISGRIVGTVMGGYDGVRGWIYSLAVHPDHQRHGHGQTLITAIEEALAAQGCHKINLQVRAGNKPAEAFYSAIGYEVEDRVSFGKRLQK